MPLLTIRVVAALPLRACCQSKRHNFLYFYPIVCVTAVMFNNSWCKDVIACSLNKRPSIHVPYLFRTQPQNYPGNVVLKLVFTFNKKNPASPLEVRTRGDNIFWQEKSLGSGGFQPQKISFRIKPVPCEKKCSRGTFFNIKACIPVDGTFLATLNVSLCSKPWTK